MSLFELFTKLLPVIEGTLIVLKNGWKSKTVIFGALLVMFSGIQSMIGDVAVFFGPYGAIATAVIGLIVIVLRVLTTEPLEVKGE